MTMEINSIVRMRTAARFAAVALKMVNAHRKADAYVSMFITINIMIRYFFAIQEQRVN